MPLTAFDRGKLKIAAHVREELDRAGIESDNITCKSGGTETHPDTARLTVTVNGHASFVDLKNHEVEDCEDIVAGEAWYRIDAFISQLK
jgi:hypothetical protein